MRSIWKGSISFGLVHIPIRLYKATEDRSVHFNLLHERCGTRVRYRRWCDTCDTELENDEIARGYPWAPDEYVIVEQEDLRDLPLPTTRTVAIRDFIRLDAVDPVYFERSYYLEPVEGGGRAYALLLEAMRRTNRVAVGKVALRSKEHLACLRVYRDRGLVLDTMRYPDEIRSPDRLAGFGDEVGPVDERELSLALDLIERLTAAFEPERYRDEYREALLERIEAKVRGREVTVSPEEPEPRVVDLMEALQASLERVEAGADARGAERSS